MTGRDTRRGVVLLAVIALTATASLAVALATFAAQTHAIGARAAVKQAEIRALHEAALATTVYQLLATDNPAFSPDGRLAQWRMDGGEIAVRIVAEAGRLDLNTAPARELEGLAQRLGASGADAAILAQAFQARRGLFIDPIEARALPGMTAALFAQLEPYLTVHGEAAASFYAPPALLDVRNPPNRAAITAARAEGLPPPRSPLLRRFAIFLDVQAPDGPQRAEMIIIETPGADAPYEILSRRRLTPGSVTQLFEARS
jgi:general secretion pathway protein K